MKISQEERFRESLRSVTNKAFPLEDDDFNAFAEIWQQKNIFKKETISRQGQQEEYLYFVIEGIQRIYFLDEKGKESTIVFTYFPSFGGVIDSFFNRTPSKYNYEALTDSTLYKASYSHIQQVIKERPQLSLLLQNLMSQTIAGLLDRLVEMQSCTAEEKFIKFFSRSPHMLHLVPQKYLANYLGIDYTNFSKFINRIKI